MLYAFFWAIPRGITQKKVYNMYESLQSGESYQILHSLPILIMNCCGHKNTVGQAHNVMPEPQGYVARRDISNEKNCLSCSLAKPRQNAKAMLEIDKRFTYTNIT